MDGDEGADEHRWSWWQILLHPIASYDDLAETLQSSPDSTYKEIGTGARSNRWELVSFTVALALNVVLLLAKFALPHAWRLPFGVGLLVLSCIFAWRFFNKTKLYHIYKRAGSQPLKSPSIRTTIKSPRKAASAGGNSNEITEVYELQHWDPPIIARIVFCFFSPLQVAVVLAADDSDWMAIIFALSFAAVIAVSITYMYRVFTTWKKDQELIFKEVYDEQTRFMLSQTARPKADAAIQADAVDTLETSLLYPAYPPTVIVVPPTPVQTTPKSYSGGSRVSAGVQTTPGSTTTKRRKKNPFQQGDE